MLLPDVASHANRLIKRSPRGVPSDVRILRKAVAYRDDARAESGCPFSCLTRATREIGHVPLADALALVTLYASALPKPSPIPRPPTRQFGHSEVSRRVQGGILIEESVWAE